MTPQSLHDDALSAIASGTGMTLVFSARKPKGFPKGEFLSETGYGKVYRFDPRKVIDWIEKNNLLNASKGEGK